MLGGVAITCFGGRPRPRVGAAIGGIAWGGTLRGGSFVALRPGSGFAVGLGGSRVGGGSIHSLSAGADVGEVWVAIRVRPPLVSDAGRGLPAVELSFPVSAVLPSPPPASDSSSDSEEVSTDSWNLLTCAAMKVGP